MDEKKISRDSLDRWGGVLATIANILEIACIIGFFFVIFLLWLGSNLDAAEKTEVVDAAITHAGSLNFALIKYWLPALRNGMEDTAIFWILYVMLVLAAILLILFYHEFHALAISFVKDPEPFTREGLHRIRDLGIIFVAFSPSVLNLVIALLGWYLFRYAVHRQEAS